MSSDRLLKIMLKAIHLEVESRLHQALHQRIYQKNIDPKTKPCPLDIPGKIYRYRGNKSEAPLLKSANIAEILVDSSIPEKILIRGVQGSGKTTLLLQLAKELLNRAMNNSGVPLPILLDISSWQNNQPAIASWILSMLKLKYHLNRQTAKNLLKPDQVIILFDGLDELDDHAADKFIQQINHFLCHHWSGSLVICAGLNPQQTQLSIVNIDRCIDLQPLTLNSVYHYLVQSDCEYLWNGIHPNPNLTQIAEIPLFLNLIIIAAREINLPEWQAGKNQSERLSYLWDAYVRTGLKIMHKSDNHTEEKLSKKDMFRSLSWLAQKSLNQKQPEFYHLEDSWLENPLEKILSILIMALIAGGIAGVIFWVIFDRTFGFVFGASLGGIMGVIAGIFRQYLIPPKPAFSFTQQNCIIAAVGTLVSAVICGVISGNIFGQILGKDSGLIYGLLFAVNGGLIFALVSLFTGGFSSTESQLLYQIRGGDRPAKQWLKNLLPYGTITLPMGIFWLWILWILQGKNFQGWQLCIGGMVIGILLAIAFGGIAEIHQFSLHLILWFNRRIPWQYRQLLNDGKTCLFLQQIKGIPSGRQRSYNHFAYRFIHPLFSQHLAHKLMTNQRK